MDRWSLHREGHTLIVDVGGTPSAPVITIGGRHGEVSLTLGELEWLQAVAGPAAILEARRRLPAADPQAIRPSPMQGETTPRR